MSTVEPYKYLRQAVLRKHPGARLQPEGLGFVVQDGEGRPLGQRAYSISRAWVEAYEVVKANA